MFMKTPGPPAPLIATVNLYGYLRLAIGVYLLIYGNLLWLFAIKLLPYSPAVAIFQFSQGYIFSRFYFAVLNFVGLPPLY